MKIDRSLSLGKRRILAGSVANALLPESIARFGASQPLSRRSNRRFRILSAKGFLAIAGLLATETLPTAQATTATFDLGALGNPTTIYGDIFIPWSLGVVPAGNFLQSVSINATIEGTDQDNWASELMFLVQPALSAPGNGAGILEIGPNWGADPSHGAITHIFWPESGNNGPISTVADSRFSIIDFPSTINLSTSNLFLMNAYGPGYGAWSGSITITYGAAPSNLTWTGADATSPTQWSTAPGVLNWSGGTAFTDGSATLFDDSVGTGSRLVQISNGDVSPAGMTVDTAGAYTFSGTNAITGAAGLTKQGTGLLTVNTANSYTGPTLISLGTLKLGNAAALPHGAGKGFVRVDGTLDLNGFSTTMNGLLGTGTVTNSAAGSITVTAGDTNASSVFSGIIQDGAGQIGLTKTGAGTLTLSGLSTYTGKTIIQEGTLYLGLTNNSGTGLTNAGVPGPMGAPTGANAVIDMYNGTALQTGDTNPRVNQTTDRTINLAGAGAGTVTIKVNDNDTNFTFGSVTATGTGAKTLALFTGFRGNGDREALIFNGSINDGTASTVGLQVNFRTQTGSSSYVSLNEGGTFTGPITLIKVNQDPCSYYLTVGGTQTRDLITPGSGTLGTVSPGVGSYAGNISLDTDTIFHYVSSASQTLSGAISGAGSIRVDATGTLILAGASTYTGGTTVNHGTLATGAINALPSAGTVTLANSSTAGLALNGFNQTIAVLTGGGSLGGNVALGGAILTVGNNTPMTYSGAISGAGGITKVGTGVLTLNSQSTYSGPTTITTGTLKLEAPAAVGTTYDFNDNTLQGWHNRAWDTSLNSNAGGWADLNPNITTLPNSINGGVIQPTTGGDGYLFANRGGWIGPADGFSTDNHRNTLWLVSPEFNLTPGGLISVEIARGQPQASAPANANAVPFAAIENGGWMGVALRDSTTGQFVLTVARNHVGDDYSSLTFTSAQLAALNQSHAYTLNLINIDKGGWGWISMDNVFISGVAGNVLPSTTAVSLAGSTTLNLNSVNQQIGSLADGGVEPQNHRVLLGSATLTVGDSTSTTFTGAITGSTGSVTKVGSGKLTLTGFNVYSGSTSLNAGILAVSGDEALGSTGTSGAILKFNGGTLETTADFNSDRRINVLAPGGNFNTNGLNATLTGVISGVGTLTKTGAGTLTLDPAADLTALGGLTAGGGTTLIDGQLGNGSAVASATNGGHLAFGTVSQTLASLDIGAGSTVSFSSGAASAFGAPGFKSTALVPEPGTIGLLLVGTLGLLGRRRRD